MYILGISAFYHDSAVSLIKDGEILSAAQEERFTRIKHDPSFPIEAIQYCLSEQKIKLSDVDYIVFYEKPFLKFDRLLENYFAFAPKGFLSYIKAMPAWIGEKLFLKNLMIKKLKKIDSDYNYKKTPLLFTEHHQSHTASAYYPSPFDEAIIITADGVGEWSTTTISLGKGHELREVRKIEYPHSLGLLYSAFTYFTGFKVNSGEYKLMGLAPYGRPLYVDKIKQNIIDIKDDGSFHLNMDYFTFATSGRMTHHKFEELFNCKTRKPESPLEQIHMDLAASVQQVTEEIMIKMVNYAVREFGIKKLCLAGGVALNCVANGEILRRCEIDDIWIQPAAGDAGGALGAALSVWHQYLNKPKLKTSSDTLKGTYLGPEFTDSEIEEMLNKKNIAYTKADSKDSLCHQVVDHITNDKTIGWFQGRMEYGPRALGNRSILGDPRNPESQTKINLKIKFRESFRPFAPAILSSELNNWFKLNTDSPYMLLVAPVQKDKQLKVSSEQEKLFGIEKLKVPKSEIPAVTHVDYSARVQTVHQETNPLFHKLLSTMNEKTGCPVLVNTSFNVRGEPIVCTPHDALECFSNTDIDVLVLGNCIIEKKNIEVDTSHRALYLKKFQLD